ncbi:hypothetical protein CEUSTIGMA_g2015.t1 [Chlamydomonas eustigma]|uniref:Uncharacterized protein n=1 Tax=Chlamydomonas eustigma TaxID=1157962 RepID=A0A250WUZ1_9CHLO|nr:hypothetical protein CEUSTIGMA_g2015.t1 [Chlamydomonas eustigma]|eukprot:GAX74566.1 hypothetical protein CEUSTIGMA_g2015.t1 [Chlamydomonas eustigma]
MTLTWDEGLEEEQQHRISSSILPKSASKLLITSPGITTKGGFIIKRSQEPRRSHQSVNKSHGTRRSELPHQIPKVANCKQSKLSSELVSDSDVVETNNTVPEEAESRQSFQIVLGGACSTSSVPVQGAVRSRTSMSTHEALRDNAYTSNNVETTTCYTSQSVNTEEQKQRLRHPQGLRGSDDHSGQKREDILSDMPLDKAVLRCTSAEDLMWHLRTVLLDKSKTSNSHAPASATASRSRSALGTSLTGASISSEQMEAMFRRLTYLQKGLPLENSLKYKRVADAVCSFLITCWQQQYCSMSNSKDEFKVEGTSQTGNSGSAPSLSSQTGNSGRAPSLSQAQRAVQLLQDIATLGPLFYSRSLTSCLLDVVEEFAQAKGESTESPAPSDIKLDLLARSLCACAQSGHLFRHSDVTRYATTLLDHLRTCNYLTPSTCIDVLWALGRYRLVLQEQEDIAVQGVMRALSLLQRAWITAADSRELNKNSPPNYSDAISKKCNNVVPDADNKRHGARRLTERLGASVEFPSWIRTLSIEEATRLLTAIADLELQPEDLWVDEWLSTLIPHFDFSSAPLTRTDQLKEDKQSANYLLQASSFFTALARFGYQPKVDWIKDVTARIQTLLLIHTPSHRGLSNSFKSNKQGGTAVLSGTSSVRLSIVAILEALAVLQIQPSPMFCSCAVRAVVSKRAFSSDGYCGVVARLMATLPTLIADPAGWVRENLSLLELLIVAVSPLLRTASSAELTAVISACAALKFYPGVKFLRWHDASCTKLNRAFPDKQLCQVRESYITLGFKPEKRLYERMEASRIREHKLLKSLRIRQRDAMRSMMEAEAELNG